MSFHCKMKKCESIGTLIKIVFSPLKKKGEFCTFCCVNELLSNSQHQTFKAGSNNPARSCRKFDNDAYLIRHLFYKFPNIGASR